jgi:heme oxygenase (biliverdin-producing, ferredoxin)
MDTPFSTLIRTASRDAHTEAKTSTFMGDLLGGRLGLDAFARYTEQLWFVYRALEDGAHALRDDPVAGPFIRPELMRVAELERDLAHLRGPGWRSRLTALPATAAYAARVEECARTWPGGYVAHHYTRYLGDLSGGQYLGRAIARSYGLSGDGLRFFVFEVDADAVRAHYRRLLDTVPWSRSQERMFLDEVLEAYRLTTAMLTELLARWQIGDITSGEGP